MMFTATYDFGLCPGASRSVFFSSIVKIFLQLNFLSSRGCRNSVEVRFPSAVVISHPVHSSVHLSTHPFTHPPTYPSIHHPFTYSSSSCSVSPCCVLGPRPGTGVKGKAGR